MYLRKFACYDQALEQMKTILKEEIAFYNLTKVGEELEEKEELIQIDLAQIKDYDDQKYIWNIGLIPHN